LLPGRIKLSVMEPLPTPLSEITALDNGTVLTCDGLALKGTDAVEIINVRLENRSDYLFHSWQACRAVRRDFNFVASKMFHRERRKFGQEQVRSLVHEIRLQAELLGYECQGFEAPPPSNGSVVPLRLVTPSAASLFRAFQMADLAYAKLNFAVEQKKLALNKLNAFTEAFEASFSDLKMYCSARNQSEKSALDIAKAEGIA
jgi:hypothetical protein